MNPEQLRLEEDRQEIKNWKQFGPYLAERAWGTVREDYSQAAEPWQYFTHDQSRSKAYRWNEDGLLGISDDGGNLCLATALWNGRDPIIKERLFGLSGPEGNHGEDVKEYYAYLDSTPTHSYMRALYKYPQQEFPYAQLLQENARRTKQEPEFELMDTGVFQENRYWDVEVEYAKASPEDILMCITVHNRGPDAASVHVLPSLWFRNDWSWNKDKERPSIVPLATGVLKASHAGLHNSVGPNNIGFGEWYLHYETESNAQMLFCENETNNQKLYGTQNASSTAKDGINDFVLTGDEVTISWLRGSKAAIHFVCTIEAGRAHRLRLRLVNSQIKNPFTHFDETLLARKTEADEYYSNLQPSHLSADQKLVQRQAFAGMLWSKQFYRYDVRRWLSGDNNQPAPPSSRLTGRNQAWETLNSHAIVSMPDTWEYPWFAAWDLAFHTVPLAHLDPAFAKAQLVLLTREWFQHPNGQLPAYEWNFSDVNPPVHAWAAWRVYSIEQKNTGRNDTAFLERVFHKLLLNFNWWVNRKDSDDRNIFQGGFLGLDNISVFDRSHALPIGGQLEQTDGTAWMGMYCLNMLQIALELAKTNTVYEDIAIKFFEHFLYIGRALENSGMWDETDGMYYDAVRLPNGNLDRLEVRSMVGLIPLLAVMTLEAETLAALPVFQERMDWFLKHRPELTEWVSHFATPGQGERRLLSLMRANRMNRLLNHMLDEQEFLSKHGLRSLSKYHLQHPFEMRLGGQTYRVGYEPAESTTGMYGGNSNWRGPIWFPINGLIVESLESFYKYYADGFLSECPTGSGNKKNLQEIAAELKTRLTSLFLRDTNGNRPVFGTNQTMQQDPYWRDLIFFYEYFHAETGAGLGASHQTGWTGFIAVLLQEEK